MAETVVIDQFWVLSYWRYLWLFMRFVLCNLFIYFFRIVQNSLCRFRTLRKLSIVLQNVWFYRIGVIYGYL